MIVMLFLDVIKSFPLRFKITLATKVTTQLALYKLYVIDWLIEVLENFLELFFSSEMKVIDFFAKVKLEEFLPFDSFSLSTTT